MEFISTKNMTNENAPEGQVLVQYLEPSLVYYSVEFAIGYYDNPNSYESGNGQGWLLWFNDRQVNVIAYAVLPPAMESKFETMKQEQFIKEFGHHPNNGNVGE